MKISVCIPQYNRCRYLLKALDSIKTQTHPDIEVIIADDCSTDDSGKVIPEYIAKSRAECAVDFKYVHHEKNKGYDGNLRSSMALGTGDYLFILGNDDALSGPDSIATLVRILTALNSPDVAFANFCEYGDRSKIRRRALKTALLGSGPDIALKTFRSFSFVGSLAFKREAFHKFNTDLYDKSIYVQIYLASRIISSGGTVASIDECLVAKDVRLGGEPANSYLDVLARDNARLTAKTGGLDQVCRVACDGILPHVPPGERDRYIAAIYKQIYRYTYPVWLLDYRKNGVYRASVNMALGCFPSRLVKTKDVPLFVNLGIYLNYFYATIGGLLLPVKLLRFMASLMYKSSKTV